MVQWQHGETLSEAGMRALVDALRQTGSWLALRLKHENDAASLEFDARNGVRTAGWTIAYEPVPPDVLHQVLEAVPGLHVSRTHLAYNPLYVMRGLHSETSPYVLFLTNGVPMTLWGNGNIGEFWGGMPVEAISKLLTERPESVGLVVPGMPASSPGMGGNPQDWLALDVFLIGSDGELQAFDF